MSREHTRVAELARCAREYSIRNHRDDMGALMIDIADALTETAAERDRLRAEVEDERAAVAALNGDVHAMGQTIEALRAEKAELVAMLKRIIAAADENCPHIEGKPWRTPKCERDYDDCIALIAKAMATEGGK